MDLQHLKILSSKVNSLEHELRAATKHGKTIDERIEALKNGINTIHTNRANRLQDIEIKFEAEISDQHRQIKLAGDILSKKKEERQALMRYLTGLDLAERTLEDLREFEWESMRRIAENMHQPKMDLLKQNGKAEMLRDYLSRAKPMLIELNNTLEATTLARARMHHALEELRSYGSLWLNTRSQQVKRIEKLQGDNERLNILIRQCISTANEHMSEYITKNVQAKCQSFLRSESSDELLNGLKKFKERQDRIIRLLQHKDDLLGSETNKLEVAKDQTHDQLRFYLDLIRRH